MKADKLQEHVFTTYTNLRYGMAAIAAAFPLLLYFGGVLNGVELQNSMSAYYHAASYGVPPMRDWFVGLLFAIGVFLYLYKGITTKENISLNFAGAFAIGVALFPMPWDCGDNCPKITTHGVCAVLLFLCIAFVSLKCTKETLNLIKDEKLRMRYLQHYRSAGVLMIASPLTAFVFTLLANDIKKYTFFIEAVGIWAFAYYWWVKSRELSHSGAELLALQSQIET